MTEPFTHAEIMEALEQREDWVRHELRRGTRVALAVIVAVGAVMVVGPFVLPLAVAVVVAAVGVMVQAVALAWLIARSPRRLSRAWSERYAVGLYLLARGMP